MRTLTIERWITALLGIAALILLGLQFSSLYVTPIHDSYLWWGDESWLMNEYRAQVTSGAFRHPQAYGSSLWIGNPFPFTSMWFTSAVYGIASLIADVSLVNMGRSVTLVFAITLLVWFWRKGRSLAISPIAILIGIALLISSRTFFLTSHSARYDILTALTLLAFLLFLVGDLQSKKSKRWLMLGLLWGGSILVSVHVTVVLLLPICYYLFARRTSVSDIALLAASAAASIGLLYLMHLVTQPSLAGETNLSENLQTIPLLRPFSWSVQSSNLLQKWELIVSFAPQIFLCLLAMIEGLRCRGLSRERKQAIILLALPMVGWLLFQPAGPSSYLIHFLPCLAFAAAISIEIMLVGNWQRIAVGAVAMFALVFGGKDAIVARDVGSALTSANHEAIAQASKLTLDRKVIALNPAQSYLPNAATTHFVELPNSNAKRPSGEGYLLTYNSSIQPNFMWEVGPLRFSIVAPELTLVGRYLDVGRSYFRPLDARQDTLFLQRLDLSALYRQHID